MINYIESGGAHRDSYQGDISARQFTSDDRLVLLALLCGDKTTVWCMLTCSVPVSPTVDMLCLSTSSSM